MGLTSHGLRDIGDVVSVRSALPSPQSSPPSAIGESIEKDNPMLLLEWEGYAITSADELYHAVWENDQGIHEVASSVSGMLKEIRDVDPSREGIDETDVLAVVISSREDLEKVAGEWVGEEEYRKILDSETLKGVSTSGDKD